MKFSEILFLNSRSLICRYKQVMYTNTATVVDSSKAHWVNLALTKYSCGFQSNSAVMFFFPSGCPLPHKNETTMFVAGCAKNALEHACVFMYGRSNDHLSLW